MKQIKNLMIAALVLVGAMMMGCDRVEENLQQQEKGNLVTLKITVGLERDETTKALTDGGSKTFAVGDQIAVVYTNTSSQTVKATSVALTSNDITNNNKTASFTVTLDNPVTGSVEYVYPAAMANDNGSMASIAAQDGTLETLQSKYDYATGTGNLTKPSDSFILSVDGPLTNQLAICKFNIKNAGSPITHTITKLTVSDGTNVYTVTQANPSTAFNEKPIFIAMIPVNNGDMEFSATDGTNNYDKIVKERTLAANKIYSINLEMALHNYVDFGLPSGTLWATCNIGATNPEDPGDYFAWGATDPWYSSLSPSVVWKNGKSSGYVWANSPYYTESGPSHSWLKYTGSSSATLDSSDDAATANWGSSWCTPTVDQWRELQNNTTYDWVGTTHIKIYKSDKPSNYIILPTVGYWDGTSLNGIASSYSNGYGYYWTSSLYFVKDDHYPYDITSWDPDFAWFAYFYYPSGLSWKGKSNSPDEIYRYCGMPVRPVRTLHN